MGGGEHVHSSKNHNYSAGTHVPVYKGEHEHSSEHLSPVSSPNPRDACKVTVIGLLLVVLSALVVALGFKG
jgi:hypothetical protein